MKTSTSRSLKGILLAAGRGRRFDPSGHQNKLMQLRNGEPVALQAARNLLAALDDVTAVVRDADSSLALQLAELGCHIVECSDADSGMAASLRCGVGVTRDAAGWLIALADMPEVTPQTISLLAQEIVNGAGIAAPFMHGQRGNPVAFGAQHLNALLSLEGDSGARALLQAQHVVQIDVNDPGIHYDIDSPADLAR